MDLCRRPIHCILPPYILDHMANSPNPAVRRLAIEGIAVAAEARATRTMLAKAAILAAVPSPAARKHRLVYDAGHRSFESLPGRLVRAEGHGPTRDAAANEAYTHSGTTYDFYWKIFGRNSLDGRGMALRSTVHFGRLFNNAFWTGEQMVYGDGDGVRFLRFTKAVDVVGHELSHGVVTHTSNLAYRDEPGALNEHFADVFGTLIKQWRRRQTVRDADWLIGKEIMGPGVTAKGLRTFTAEKAFERDPVLGTDPQPKHMRQQYTGTADNGGVHINSGIPNHAFYLAAMALGGRAWEQAGRIWYRTLLALNQTSDFRQAAEMTVQAARAEFGAGSKAQRAVRAAWKGVGL